MQIDPNNIRNTIRRRFERLDEMTSKALKGEVDALVVSGAPGVGKSYGLMKKLRFLQKLCPGVKVEIMRGGNCTAAGLYEGLWNTRNGGIIVVDDCDAIFSDELGVNLLKAACDTTEERICSWKSQGHWLVKKSIPTEFVFKGTMIFLTNMDFVYLIQKGDRMAEHYKAFVDRSMYLDLGVHSATEIMIRIEQVIEENQMLVSEGLTQEQSDEVMAYVRKNADRFYTLSLRTLVKIAKFFTPGSDHWKEMAEDVLIGR